MKLKFVLSSLGILLFFKSSGVVGDSGKDSSSGSTRQAPVFSATHNSFPDAGSDSQQVTLYDTLGNKRQPSEAYTISQQQGKSNFGLSSFVSGESSSGYPNSYASPASPSTSYIPLGNQPTPGYPDPRPTLVVHPTQPQLKPEESYAYYYQHYPNNPPQYGVQSTSGSGSPHFGGLFDSDIFGGLGSSDIGGAGGALGGLGALGVAGLATLAKGALALKPILILGFLLLLALPLLLLFLPIPIITIPTPVAPGGGGRAHQIATAVTTLTQKVLGSEECLERILCKIPPVPKKFQPHVRSLWMEYGSKVVHFPRISRGLEAYFNSTDLELKHKSFKCNTQFKCSNKFF